MNCNLKKTIEIPLDIIQDDQGRFWYELNHNNRQGPFDDQYQMSLHIKETLNV